MNDSDVLAHFTTYLLTEKRAPHNTFSAYKRDITQLLTYIKDQDTSITTCDVAHLKNYIGELRRGGISAKSVARKISSMKLFFAFCSKRLGVVNKAEGLVFPKLDKTFPVFLTNKEIEKLLEVTQEDTTPKGIRNSTMIYLMYASGMRVSELINITIDTIHFDTGFITFMGKGGKERSVPLPQTVLELLRFFLDEVHDLCMPRGIIPKKNYLFASYQNGKEKPLTRQNVWIILKRLIAQAGIKKNISPHSLRHSLATHLLKNGVDLRALQILLGHQNLKTIEVYTHLDTSDLREVYDKKHPRARD